jgi:formate dehydrogenase
MAKILCVLYDDPIRGYPQSAVIPNPMRGMAFRKSTVIPAVNRRRRRNTSISSQASFSALSRVNLGCAKFLEGLGHTFVVTSDKERIRPRSSNVSFPMPK